MADAPAEEERRKSTGSQGEVGQKRRSRASSDLKAADLSRLKVRRPSYGFGGVPGVRPLDQRTSLVGLEFKRPILCYLPTYQLDSYKKFHLANVLKIIDATLDEEWNGHKYNETESPALALKLAGDIMRKVKLVGYNRYKIITIVTIGQRRKQSYNNSVGFLWDYERDGYVDTHREEFTAFVQESPALALKLAGDIMRKVKLVGYNRYKIITIVTIGQRRKQSYNNSVGFLWDYERDGYVDTHREEFTAFVQVTVFGMYFD